MAQDAAGRLELGLAASSTAVQIPAAGDRGRLQAADDFHAAAPRQIRAGHGTLRRVAAAAATVAKSHHKQLQPEARQLLLAKYSPGDLRLYRR